MTGRTCPPGCECGRHPATTTEDRFWAKVAKTDGCWLWMAAVDHDGYGRFWNRSAMVLAHRYAYELVVGPSDAQLDHRHTCPKNCVRPDHLRPVTDKQNKENHAGARRDSKSGVRGVSWHVRGKWIVQVKHQGKTIYGGLYAALEDAETAAIALRNRLFTHNDADRGATTS